MSSSQEARSVSSSGNNVAKVLQDCIDFVSNAERASLGKDRLHLFYESSSNNSIASPQNNSEPSNTPPTYSLHVLFSSTVSFASNRTGAGFISNGFALFNSAPTSASFKTDATPAEVLRKNNIVNDLYMSVPSPDEQSAPRTTAQNNEQPPGAPARSNSTSAQMTDATDKDKTDLDKAFEESCDALVNGQLLSWFPGKFEKVESDEDDPIPGGPTGKKRKYHKSKKPRTADMRGDVLTVNGSIVDHFARLKMEVTLNVYKAFFSQVHDCINQSKYKKNLVRERCWIAKFAYHDFTAPWMKRTISVRNELVYLNPSGILCIPHFKSLRSLEGARKAKYVLAAFYQQEPCIRHILRKVLFDKTSTLMPPLAGEFRPSRPVTNEQPATNLSSQQQYPTLPLPTASSANDRTSAVPSTDSPSMRIQGNTNVNIAPTSLIGRSAVESSPTRRLNKTRRRVSDESDSDDNIVATPSPRRQVDPNGEKTTSKTRDAPTLTRPLESDYIPAPPSRRPSSNQGASTNQAGLYKHSLPPPNAQSGALSQTRPLESDYIPAPPRQQPSNQRAPSSQTNFNNSAFPPPPTQPRDSASGPSIHHKLPIGSVPSVIESHPPVPGKRPSLFETAVGS